MSPHTHLLAKSNPTRFFPAEHKCRQIETGARREQNRRERTACNPLFDHRDRMRILFCKGSRSFAPQCAEMAHRSQGSTQIVCEGTM